MYHSFAALDINNCPEEQILDCQPEAEDGAGDENPDEEEIPMIEDSPSGIKLIFYFYTSYSSSTSKAHGWVDQSLLRQ